MSDLTARLDRLSPQERTALLNLLRKKKGGAALATAPALSRPADREDLPLSFAQQRLWFLDRLAPGSPLYNLPGTLRCTGRLHPAVLAACLSEVVRRHAALRTRFAVRGDGPVQVIEPAAPLPLPVVDLAALPAAIRVPEEQRLVRAEHLAPFDLGRPPLVRARLLRLAAEEHLFVYVFHHIASDGWSLDVAIAEVAALYGAFLEGLPSPLPELPLQYADFAWEQVHAFQGEALERELGYWRSRLAGAPVLELPTDRPRPAVPSFRGAALEAVLPPAVEAGLRELARGERVTQFMALLAPLCALLARLADSVDVVVGTVVTGRDRWQLKDLIGFFVNTLVLRFDLSADPDCRALLARSREVVLGAFGHQALPFEKLVDELGLPRDPYRPPLLRVLIQLLPASLQPAALPGLSLERYRLPNETSKFDLVVNALDLQDRTLLEWRHDADLFDPDTIARWAGCFDVLLAAWVSDPSLRASELPLLTAGQREQLLGAPRPAAPDRGRRSLPALFEAQVDRTPEAPAVSPLTYRELDERANGLARWLVRSGVVPGDRVALRLDRSADLIVSLIAVLKTGAAYVPLDPASPRERLAFALEDSGVSLVLDTDLLERERDAIARQSRERLGWRLDPELPAYVIYTSGSTGRPKGVIVPHGAVSRLFAATEAWFGFGPGDVWTLFHSYAFDFSVWEIWGALLYGGRLVVVPWSVSRDPEAFRRLLREERVTVLNQTPSAFRQLEPSPPAPLPQAGEGTTAKTSLRWVIFGGEALDPTALEPWFLRYGDQRPRLVNMYGITETTVHVTWRLLSRQDATRPASLIGQPIPDLTLHVLDRHLELQPLGVPGEICVGGEGLAHGYLGRPELTAARFVPDPFGPPGARLYRSGDLARRRPDGELEYLGRIDHQVKIRGFRIELGEIEAALAALPGVREADVQARPDGPDGAPWLVAYVTAGEEGAPTLAGMRESLARRLPDYMIPAALVVLDRLPLTANGKVNRLALPVPGAAPAAASGHEHVPPRDAVEAWCAGLFRQILNLPAAREIGALDDFFALGGTSISGAVLINRLQETLGEIVQVVVIFDHSTVESLAAYVRDEHPAAAARLWGVAAEAGEAEIAPVGPVEVAEMRRLIVEGRPSPPDPLSHPHSLPPRRGGMAVFLLSPPRSGSTLLRVMLGGHPRLFAPPELELLSFETLAGRQAAFSGRDSFWLEGVIRAVMEARSCDAAEAERIVAAATEGGWTTRRLYRELQGWIGDRLLVDKTPSYALDPMVLRRAEEWFAEPRYIHLLRHPQATNRSFEEARLDQIFFRRPHRFSRRQLAELIWTVSHRNILDFLAEIPAARQTTVRFEELVRDPERVLAGLCGFLGLDDDPAMADPYRGGAGRMADGVHAESRMLGDVKFHTHGKVDAAVAERWRQAGEAPLGEPAQALAAELGYELESHGVRPIPRGPGVNRFPVSFSQLREWILDRLEPGNPAYNIPNNLRIGGPLSVPVLTEALNRLIRRHEVFRTQLAAGDEDPEPLQVVLPEVRLEVPVIDLSALPDGPREAELRHRARREAGTGFDLSAAPLLRARVVRLDTGDHGLLMTMHHIVSDGWSMGIFNRELAALYEAVAAGSPSPLPPLPVQYADYAVWLRKRLDGETLERQAGYWRQRLTGAPALLELPTDRPRPPVRSSRGRTIPFHLPQPLVGRLEEMALRHGATLFMVLLAGYQSLLARWSGQEDVVVGTYSGSRPRRELEGLIGFFINTLVLRTDLSGDPSFSDLVSRVRETTIGAYTHRDVPFEKLLEILQLPRDPSRTPLFQATLVLQNFPQIQADLSTGVHLAPLPAGEEKSDYDLALWLRELPDGIGGSLEYSTDLFDEATIHRFAAHLRTLLEAAVADPAKNIWVLPLISEDEQARQLAAWSRGPAVPEGPPLLHRLVEEQAARTPQALALEAGGVRLTYADLVERAGRAAQGLREQGIGPGAIVALAAERTPELIVDMLAVLQVGAAYLPLDPAYPQERREYMVADSGAVWFKDLKDLKDIKDEKDDTDTRSSFAPEHAAYVIYTSGSTGRPKGVVVPHSAIASFVRSACDSYAIAPGDRVLQFASISFDTSAEEIWPALASGATLVLRPEEMAASIPHFVRELERLGITVLDLPTAFWHEMVVGMEAEGLELPRGLRLVILGGEEALADRFALWQRRVGPAVRLVNTYGPTETTIVATRRELAGLAPGGTVPIGRPIPGARAYVLDRFLAPVPPGVRGELWIGGAGVARGYLGRAELTAERFRPDPFSGERGARFYRTGDLAVLSSDGDLAFGGRADRQLKIRGYRIEPGEIEAALRLHPEVRDAVVDARGSRDAKRLIAWIVPREGAEAPAAPDLRAFLRGRLPEPLLPAAFVPLAVLPLTPSGKVDRRALAEPAETRPDHAAYAEPQSALERAIAEIYRDLLRIGRIGLHDNFFDLGGHSLLIVRAHQKLKEALGREIPVLDLFRFPTVAALARHLGGEETGSLLKVQSLAEQQRAAQQRQRAAMERLRRPGGPVRR